MSVNPTRIQAESTLSRPSDTRRFRVNGMLIAGSVILLPMGLLAVSASSMAFLDPLSIDASQQLLSPSWSHLFGTDNFGRDVLARTIYGAQISLRVGLSSMLLTAFFGIFFGVVSGWYKRADAIIGRFTDSLMIFPGFVLAIMIMAAVGPSEFSVIISVAVLYTPQVVRTVRASIVEFRDAEFVEAARTVGVGDFRLLFVHMFPKAAGPVMVQLSFGFAWAVLVEAGLSFLGLGTPPPAPSWGSMIAEARDFIRTAWWLITIPGGMITLTVLGLNLIGDGLRDLIDPRLKNGGGPMMKTKSSGQTRSRTNLTDFQKHEPLLDIQNLEVQFPGASGPVTVLDNLNLSIAHGEIFGLVGESGCGKSMLARSIIGLVPAPGKIAAGQILFKGDDLLTLDEQAMRNVRGDQISIILQEPMTSLNPVFTVGNQITEVLAIHRPEMTQNERRQHAVDMMERIGIQSPDIRLDQYPHELSGGIRQRVMISIALICGNVQLLIADEPTTALDVTIQAQILELFVKLQTEHQMALLLITHDLSVIAQTAHRVAVMYAGRLVEIADVVPLFDSPRHPYTRGLMRSLPRIGTRPRKSHMPVIPGTVPDLAKLPPGCPFFDRCEHRREEPCLSTNPKLEEVSDGHSVRCHCWRDIPRFEPASPPQATL